VLAEVMNSDLKPDHGPERTVNAVKRRLGNTDKARRLLGFAAQVSLREGLEALVSWWRRSRAASVAPTLQTTSVHSAIASRG
jgi:UDP-glucose 4-epimerase